MRSQFHPFDLASKWKLDVFWWKLASKQAESNKIFSFLSDLMRRDEHPNYYSLDLFADFIEASEQCLFGVLSNHCSLVEWMNEWWSNSLKITKSSLRLADETWDELNLMNERTNERLFFKKLGSFVTDIITFITFKYGVVLKIEQPVCQVDSSATFSGAWKRNQIERDESRFQKKTTPHRRRVSQWAELD